MRVVVIVALALLWNGGQACAEVPSALGLALFRGGGDAPPLLAQRTIEREWTVPGDSGVAALHPEGARSELGALGLSAALPGAGQVYAGRPGGLYFAAAEVAGWVGWLLLRHRGDQLRDDAGAVAGAPDDSASAWSFDRWQSATAGDEAALRALYAADREAFYDAIASDSRYAAGWSSAGARTRFDALRQRSDQRLQDARWTGAALWVNHLLAAVDAMRAARLYNLDVGLAGNVKLKARGRLHDGRPGLVVTLQRGF